MELIADLDRDESNEVPDNVGELANQFCEAGAGRWMDCNEQVFLSTVVMLTFRYACKSDLLEACFSICQGALYVHGQYWVKVHKFPRATECCLRHHGATAHE